MASESADPALYPAVISFVIAEKTWKLGDPIHSTGAGAVKNKIKWSKLLDQNLPQQGLKESSWAEGLGTNIL